MSKRSIDECRPKPRPCFLPRSDFSAVSLTLDRQGAKVTRRAALSGIATNPFGSITLEQFRGKASVTIERHPQLQLADARDQAAVVVPGTVTRALRAALAGGCAHHFGHLGFENFLQRFLEQTFEQIPVLAPKGFNRHGRRFNLVCGGHGDSALRAGWLRQSTFAMTATCLQAEFAHKAEHYQPPAA